MKEFFNRIWDARQMAVDAESAKHETEMASLGLQVYAPSASYLKQIESAKEKFTKLERLAFNSYSKKKQAYYAGIFRANVEFRKDKIQPELYDKTLREMDGERAKLNLLKKGRYDASYLLERFYLRHQQKVQAKKQVALAKF